MARGTEPNEVLSKPERCLFAVASFMLALIGLKKFRSFWKPNRIARNFDAFDGRRDTKQGFWGQAPEWREFGAGSGAGLGTQRRILGL